MRRRERKGRKSEDREGRRGKGFGGEVRRKGRVTYGDRKGREC